MTTSAPAILTDEEIRAILRDALLAAGSADAIERDLTLAEFAREVDARIDRTLATIRAETLRDARSVATEAYGVMVATDAAGFREDGVHEPSRTDGAFQVTGLLNSFANQYAAGIRHPE